MGKCHNCNLEILDVSQRCPLCRTVLEPTDELENMYPDVRLQRRRLLFACRLYLFLSLLLEGALVTVDHLTGEGLPWSAITGLALLLGYLIFRFGVASKMGYRSKIIFLTLAVVLCAIVLDFIVGYSGWSLDYVIPAGILVVDLFIIVYMVFNRRNWQSYLMWQLLMVLLSLIPMALWLTGLERNPYLAFLPLVVSTALFVGTVMIGDRRAAEELRRRFHFR